MEQAARLGDVDIGAPEFAFMARFNLAAELLAHRLLAVADAEHRNAEGEDDLRRTRAALVEHRGRAAGEDDGARGKGGDPLGGGAVGPNLAIHTALAHAACDQLSHLTAEIEDENAVGDGGLGHGGILAASATGCSALHHTPARAATDGDAALGYVVARRIGRNAGFEMCHPS